MFVYYIQHFFICRPSDFTVSEDDGIELSSQIHKVVVVNFSPISQVLWIGPLDCCDFDISSQTLLPVTTRLDVIHM